MEIKLPDAVEADPMGASLDMFCLGLPKDFRKSLSSSLPISDFLFLSDLRLRLPDPFNAVGISVSVHISNMMLLRVVYTKFGCSANSFWHVVVVSFVTVFVEHTPLIIS